MTLALSGYIANVAVVWRLWKPPILSSCFRHLLQRGQFLPVLAAVFTAVERDGFHARIDHFIIRGVHRD